MLYDELPPLLYYETLSISTQSAPEQRRKSFFSLSTSAAPYFFAAAAMCWIVPCFIFTHVGIVSSPHIFYKFCASSSHLAWLSSVALTALKMLKRYGEKCLPTTSTTISTTFFRSERAAAEDETELSQLTQRQNMTSLTPWMLILPRHLPTLYPPPQTVAENST